MVTQVPMPKLGAGVYHEGVILKWAKNVGDHVNAGESIAEIETEKAISDYVSPASGTVLKLLFKEGDTVKVGTTILLLGQPGEEIPPGFLPGSVPRASAASDQASPGVGESATPLKSAEVSPAARRLAENLKVDLSSITGTGPGGSILREDILKASRSSRAAPAQNAVGQEGAVTTGSAGSRLVPLSAMRSTIARRLSKSQHETAHVTLTREVEVSALAALVKGEGARLNFGYNDVIVKATAEALKRHPMMNSRLEGDDKVRILDTVDIGVAVAVEGGLITPTIRGADKLTLTELAALVRQLSEKARARQLSQDEYEGATFTVSNLGAYGVDTFTPIINPPQVGILGVGRIMSRPWVQAGEVKVVPTVNLSLTFDHRVVDGADAALFLDSLAKLIQDTSWVGG